MPCNQAPFGTSWRASCACVHVSYLCGGGGGGGGVCVRGGKDLRTAGGSGVFSCVGALCARPRLHLLHLCTPAAPHTQFSAGGWQSERRRVNIRGSGNRRRVFVKRTSTWTHTTALIRVAQLVVKLLMRHQSVLHQRHTSFLFFCFAQPRL